MKKTILFLGAILSVTLLCSCGKGFSINTDEGKLKLDDGKLVVESKEGESEMNFGSDDKSAKLPDNYPEDLVPVVDDAKILLANKTEKDNKESYWITYTTKKPAKEVYEFYEAKLGGLEEVQKSQFDTIYTITCMNDQDNITVSVVTDDSSDEVETSVQIFIGPKEQ